MSIIYVLIDLFDWFVGPPRFGSMFGVFDLVEGEPQSWSEIQVLLKRTPVFSTSTRPLDSTQFLSPSC